MKTISKNRDRMKRMFTYIIAGMSNEAALAKILREEPKASTTLSSLQWTRSQLRNGTPYAKKYNVKNVKIRLNSEIKNRPAVSKPDPKPATKTATVKTAAKKIGVKPVSVTSAKTSSARA